MKTNYHNKNFALSLAFITRFNATRKWPIHWVVPRLPSGIVAYAFNLLCFCGQRLSKQLYAKSVVESSFALMKFMEVLMNVYFPYSFNC